MTDCSDEPEPQPFGVLPSKRRHADAEQVDQEEVLDQLRVLEVRAWRERAGDADGVAIAAIQELADRLDDRNALIEQQARQLRRQQRRLDEQRADLETLREQLESLQAECSGAGGSEVE